MTRQFKSRLVDFAFKTAIAPFLLGGILVAVVMTNWVLEHDMHAPISITWMLVFLVAMAACLYLSGLIALTLFMALAVTFVSKSRYDTLMALLPQPFIRRRSLAAPYLAVDAFFYRRLR